MHLLICDCVGMCVCAVCMYVCVCVCQRFVQWIEMKQSSCSRTKNFQSGAGERPCDDIRLKWTTSCSLSLAHTHTHTASSPYAHTHRWTDINTHIQQTLTQPLHNTHQPPRGCHRPRGRGAPGGGEQREAACGGGITSTQLGSSSGSPVDKAHPLECRSRTPRNTDELVSLCVLLLNDLRGEIKQEEPPPPDVLEQRGGMCVCVHCSVSVFVPSVCVCVFTPFAVMDTHLLLCLCFECESFAGLCVVFVSHAWLTLCVHLQMCPCVCPCVCLCVSVCVNKLRWEHLFRPQSTAGCSSTGRTKPFE